MQEWKGICREHTTTHYKSLQLIQHDNFDFAGVLNVIVIVDFIIFVNEISHFKK